MGGYSTSLALDGSGRPHISYLRRIDTVTFGLGYAYKDGSGWHTATVPTGQGSSVASDTSLALDSKGRPHISYYEASTHDLKLARLAHRDHSRYLPLIARGETAR